MSDVINKDTMEYLKSVETSKYPPENWLINPDIPTTLPQKYWKMNTGKTKIISMSVAEKTAVDQAEADKQKEYLKSSAITVKLNDMAIVELKIDNVLDNNGNYIGG